MSFRTAAAGLMLASTGVQADPEAPSLPRVEVVGSRVPRIDGETSLPVQIIRREEIERSGVATVEELLGLVSANFGGTLEAASTAISLISGHSSASLRGLGATRDPGSAERPAHRQLCVQRQLRRRRRSACDPARRDRTRRGAEGRRVRALRQRRDRRRDQFRHPPRLRRSRCSSGATPRPKRVVPTAVVPRSRRARDASRATASTCSACSTCATPNA